MKQTTFSDAEFTNKKKQTRRDRFLAEIEAVTPWPSLVAALLPYYPKGDGRGRPPVGLERMLRMYIAQQCFGLSDEGIEDAIYDSQAIRGFVGIDLTHESAPDATTLLKFRRLLEKHNLTRRIFDEINGHLAWAYVKARRYPDAVEQCQRTLDLDPHYVPAHEFLGWAYEQLGQFSEAIAEFQKVIDAGGGPGDAPAELAHAYALSGRRPEALKVLEELKRESTRRYVPSYGIATIYVALGMKDEAFAWLERAYQERSEWMVYLKVSPVLDDLRSDPRFPDLLQRVGLEP